MNKEEDIQDHTLRREEATDLTTIEVAILDAMRIIIINKRKDMSLIIRAIMATIMKKSIKTMVIIIKSKEETEEVTREEMIITEDLDNNNITTPNQSSKKRKRSNIIQMKQRLMRIQTKINSLKTKKHLFHQSKDNTKILSQFSR
jgi:hypothetical protein